MIPLPHKHENGTFEWRDEEGRPHRDNDLPAMISPRGVKKWFQHGLLHRENGPALIVPDKVQVWCKNDHPHRENDLPAVIMTGGQREWWVNGIHHRILGPALLNTISLEEEWVWRGIPMKESDMHWVMFLDIEEDKEYSKSLRQDWGWINFSDDIIYA